MNTRPWLDTRSFRMLMTTPLIIVGVTIAASNQAIVYAAAKFTVEPIVKTKSVFEDEGSTSFDFTVTNTGLEKFEIGMVFLGITKYKDPLGNERAGIAFLSGDANDEVWRVTPVHVEQCLGVLNVQSTCTFSALAEVRDLHRDASGTNFGLWEFYINVVPALGTGETVGGHAFVAVLDRGYVGPIPEPEIYAMLLAGLGVLGFAAQRRKHKRISAA